MKIRKGKEMHTYKCEQCGKEFKRTKKKRDSCRFCSRECAFKYAHEHRKANIVIEHAKICLYCGKRFTTTNSNKLYCSEECSKENGRKKARERSKAIRPISFKGKKTICRNCEKEFITEYKKSKVFCCDNCKDIYEKQKRHNINRKRLKGKVIDRDITLTKLSIRSNNMCAICGATVDWSDYKEINGTIICGEKYPSIDHIIPLSKGGMHEWSNVQLAHRDCNRIKSDEVA